ncbi:MAG: hypothetical protein Q4B40_07285 [Clostridia bacterium]|nr:hypothetical protein [Clostridia bacterium]
MSIIAIIMMAIAWFLGLFTELYTLADVLCIASFIIAIIDLVLLYKKEKLDFGDFIKEAFRTNWGSAISIIAALYIFI